MRHPIWGARFDRVRRAIFDWPYKYIHSSDGRHELYNLGADPTEQVNLADRDHERRSRLSDELAQLIGENEDQASEPLPAEPSLQLQRELKALGYLPE
jgi:arylsulfatase A-like enzyme